MIRQYNIAELKDIADNFRKELELSAGGGNSSLPFLRHHLPDKPLLDTGEKYQQIAVGGTYYKSCTGTKGDESTKNTKTGLIPKLRTKETFFDFIFNLFEDGVRGMGINFAYALKPVFRDGRLDGTLVQGSKEHEFAGLIGKTVGEEMEKYYSGKTGKNIKITVANDTICLLLSGMKNHPIKNLAAFIVGTGLNSAIVLDERTLVNLESANFDKFEQSEEAQKVDGQSADPGQAKFEKEIAGEYLYKQYNVVSTDHKIDSTQALNQLALSDDSLAQEILKRSASLAAAQAAGVANFYKKPVVFLTEGSLFWNSEKYLLNFRKIFNELTEGSNHNFVKSASDSLLGIGYLL